MSVCAVDGVAVATSRSGALVHVDELPTGVDPDHDVRAVERESWLETGGKRVDLKSAAEDMLAHHATLHPGGDCEWAARLGRAVRLA